MFRFFKRRPEDGRSKPSLDSISFDTTGYTPEGDLEPGRVRTWATPEDDGLALFYFPIPPDLSSNASSIDEIAEVYRRALEGSDGKLVEARVVEVDGCQAVRTILSVPQQPTGRTYLGSLTIPFRDFSFVIKCQCEELGPTGLREAMLFARGYTDAPVETEGERIRIPGWDPDAEEYDAEFGDHPVARLRRVLAHVSSSLKIAGDVRHLPGFALPHQPGRNA